MLIGWHRVGALYGRLRLKLALDIVCFDAPAIVRACAAKSKEEWAGRSPKGQVLTFLLC